MYFEQKLLQIALWTLLFSLILGGKVWHFPENGRFLLQEWFYEKK
jgi:hypothetical protein